MSDPKYSDFTLNFNPGARANDKAPTLKGKAKVLDSDGAPTDFDVAAWGPNKAQSGGPDFYNVTFEPKDPAHAARQLKTVIDGTVRNAIEGFELTKLGRAPVRSHRRADRQSKRRGQEPAQILRPCPGAAAVRPRLHVVKRLSKVVAPDTVVTTNGLDCQAALRALKVERPFLVFPPWFADPALPKGVAYFAAHGFDPAGHMRVDPGRKWRDVPPRDLYPQGMAFEQEVEHLYRQVRARCPAEADGVLMVGTGLRCVGVLEALEEDLQKPVMSANQASLWHCLRLSGVNTPVKGYGKLLLI